MRNSAMLSATAVGAGATLLLGAEACSSFTTTLEASSDAAPDASGVTVIDGSGPDASSADLDSGGPDPGLEAAIAPARVNNCAEWASDAHSATFQPINSGAPDMTGCQLCPDGSGPSFVELQLPSLDGTYTITAQGKLAGEAVVWGVGFRRSLTAAGEHSEAATPNYMSLNASSSAVTDRAVDTFATLELDNAANGFCVDIKDIAITFVAR